MTQGVGIEMVYDDAQLRDAAARLRAFPVDRAQAMWDAIGAAMVAKTQLRFRTGVGPDGAPWKPSKRVLKDGGQTLVKSRRLLDSQTHNVLPDNGGVEWGSNVVYAAIHQLGGKIHREAHSQSIFQHVNKAGEVAPRFVKKKKSNFERTLHVGAYDINMPARPYLGIDADDLAEVQDIETAHLEAALLGTSVRSVRSVH